MQLFDKHIVQGHRTGCRTGNGDQLKQCFTKAARMSERPLPNSLAERDHFLPPYEAWLSLNRNGLVSWLY